MEFAKLPFDSAADHTYRQFAMIVRYVEKKNRKNDSERPSWWKKKGRPPSADEAFGYRLARAEWDRNQNRLGFNTLTLDDYRRGRHLRKE